MLAIPMELKREFGFDAFGRYADLARILDFNRNGRKRLRILDIGGRGNPLGRFLPVDDVFYLDPNIEDSDPKFIRASALSIPADDASFDFVTSADVLEHIPGKDRELFLRESIRAAKRGVVHVAPFESDAVRNVEIRVNNLHRHLFEEDHVWLVEHIENGLPLLKDFLSTIEEAGHSYRLFTNNDLRLWELVYTTFFTITALEENRGLQDDFNEFYNTSVYPQDSSSETYRTGILIPLDETVTLPSLREGDLSAAMLEETARKLIELNFLAMKEQKPMVLNWKREREECYREFEKLRTSCCFRLGGILLHPWKNFLSSALRNKLRR